MDFLFKILRADMKRCSRTVRLFSFSTKWYTNMELIVHQIHRSSSSCILRFGFHERKICFAPRQNHEHDIFGVSDFFKF